MKSMENSMNSYIESGPMKNYYCNIFKELLKCLCSHSISILNAPKMWFYENTVYELVKVSALWILNKVEIKGLINYLYVCIHITFRDDEDEISAFPVVKESGDKLIETGINTLQKTLLLKKDVEVEKVQADLEEKRYEFKKRMEACSQRQIHVQKKQQQVSILLYCGM